VRKINCALSRNIWNVPPNSTTSAGALRKRFADVAACYRLLAKVRERLIAAGSVEGETLVDPPSHLKGDTHL
jgi:hypothetical protein